MVFNTYKSKFSEPALGEGFSEIVKVHFTPLFDNDHHAQLNSIIFFIDFVINL